ncbi:MAG: sulfite exporter TauE/SafE family protein [Lentisphaerae bacterium]|nr:sulfite exporter TauE/SafE family protein [Lentisphaerota bacterium]
MKPDRARPFCARPLLPLTVAAVILACTAAAHAAGRPLVPAATDAAAHWWIWPALLFIVTFGLGIVSVMGGVGGGVLFVPIVGGLFPIHLDYVRAAGLVIALAGSLSASPTLLRRDMASLRLALPAALVASVFSAAGATVGLALPQRAVQIALGLAITGVGVLYLRARSASSNHEKNGDAFAMALGIRRVYHESSSGAQVEWSVRNTRAGFAAFSLIGFAAGMFGLGAGWANVPVLNLAMGAPLKIAMGTSSFLLSVTDTSAVWIYINHGALLPLVAVPSILGMVLGAKIGVRLMIGAKPESVRKVVICLLFIAGARSILKGIGIWS